MFRLCVHRSSLTGTVPMFPTLPPFVNAQWPGQKGGGKGGGTVTSSSLPVERIMKHGMMRSEGSTFWHQWQGCNSVLFGTNGKGATVLGTCLPTPCSSDSEC
eukprot:96983-Amphidinium_carterae.1